MHAPDRPRLRVVNERSGCSLGEAITPADTFSRRLIGLLLHDRLEPSHGLWITPCRGIHMFFMRFAIDVVFIDESRRVTCVFHALRPWRTAFGGMRARGVLELPAGTAAAADVKVGDRLDFSSGR